MKAVLTLTLLALCLDHSQVGKAQTRMTDASNDAEITTLQQQNAILEARIKLITQQRQLERLDGVDAVSRQTDALDRRIKLYTEQQSLLNLPVAPAAPRTQEMLPKDDMSMESIKVAYTALSSVAPNVAKDLACTGNNVVLYGPSQSQQLFTLRAFNDQIEVLRARLKSVLDVQAPGAPDQSAADASVYGVGALSGPVLQSVLDLISLLHASSSPYQEEPLEENALIALIANAANGLGCRVYWPDQYSVNPFNPSSRVMAALQTLADLNDSGAAAGKPAGLQQRLRVLRTELKRSDTMGQSLAWKIQNAKERLKEAADQVELVRAQIDFTSKHIHDEKDAAVQAKLNKTFAANWDELDQAVKKQLAVRLPQTMEDQSKVNEMSKRLDLLKAQSGFLAQYVKDEKDLVMQERLKRALAVSWEELEAADKNYRSMHASITKTIEPDEKELGRWDRYSADLKELIGTTEAASEAYMTFRAALLDGSSGLSPLSRLLRAESLRNLTFDEHFQEVPGSSIVQLKLQRIAGTSRTKLRPDSKEGFSGGVVLSYVQYEPNGKVKNSGVQTAYGGFQNP